MTDWDKIQLETKYTNTQETCLKIKHDDSNTHIQNVKKTTMGEWWTHTMRCDAVRSFWFYLNSFNNQQARIPPCHGDNTNSILSYNINKQNPACEIKTNFIFLMGDKNQTINVGTSALPITDWSWLERWFMTAFWDFTQHKHPHTESVQLVK